MAYRKMMGGLAPALLVMAVFPSRAPTLEQDCCLHGLVDEKQVGVPVFFGLWVLMQHPSGTKTINGTKVEFLPSVVGQTYAPVEQVEAFYAEKLSHWNYVESHDSKIYWKGDSSEEYDPVNDIHVLTRPSIWIIPPRQSSTEILPVTVLFYYER